MLKIGQVRRGAPVAAALALLLITGLAACGKKAAEPPVPAPAETVAPVAEPAPAPAVAPQPAPRPATAEKAAPKPKAKGKRAGGRQAAKARPSGVQGASAPAAKPAIAAPGPQGSEARFQRDLEDLKDCDKLRALAKADPDRKLNAYETRLKWKLVPWFLAHCAFS